MASSVVEIRLEDKSALADMLIGMREWLDHRRCEPSVFRCKYNVPGIVYEIEFASDTEATDFATAFGGRIVPVQAPVARVAG